MNAIDVDTVFDPHPAVRRAEKLAPIVFDPPDTDEYRARVHAAAEAVLALSRGGGNFGATLALKKGDAPGTWANASKNPEHRLYAQGEAMAALLNLLGVQ